MEAFERGYLLERACAMRSLEERLRPQPRRAATLAIHLRKVEDEAAAVPVVRAVGGRVGERHVKRLFGGSKKLDLQLQEALRDATTQVRVCVSVRRQEKHTLVHPLSALLRAKAGV